MQHLAFFASPAGIHTWFKKEHKHLSQLWIGLINWHQEAKRLPTGKYWMRRYGPGLLHPLANERKASSQP